MRHPTGCRCRFDSCHIARTYNHTIEMNKAKDTDALEALTEKPVQFNLAGRDFVIKPPTIGKQAILSRYIAELELDEESLEKRPISEANRLYCTKTDIALRFMAVAVSNGKRELQDEKHLDEVADFFRWNAEPTLFADIVKIVVSMSDFINFTIAIRLAKTYALRIGTADNRVAEERQG